MLILENVQKAYGKKVVLRDLDATFAAGSITGIVGKNGAGKTTLFRCIAGLEKYLGKISTTLGDRNGITGFMDTNPYYLAKLTGREYLRLLADGRGLSMPDFAKINLFDLPLDQYASTYSTGMKKKLALTGVLLQGNEIFIFDEPFNGLDIESSILLKAVLRKLKAAGKVVLVSSHVFSILGEICDTLYYLSDGKINRAANDRKGFAEIEDLMAGEGVLEKIGGLKI